MYTLLIEIINRINLFSSHPLADIFRPHILEINFGTYIDTATGIKCMQYMIQYFADDAEIIVIEQRT